MTEKAKMKTDTQKPIERIRKASRVVRSACTFLLGAGAQVLAVLIGCIMAWQCGIAPTVPIKFDPSSLIPFTGGDSGAIGSAVAGSVIILISWVMDTGRGMREENELTI